MATILKDYGSGGAGLGPIHGLSAIAPGKRHAPIALVLRDIADDLGSAKTAVNAAIADRAAAKTQIDALVTDVASIRTQLTAAIADRAAAKTQIDALVVDLTAVRAKFLTLTAKLDLDAGVTDANYAATQNPAALTAVAAAAPTAVNPSAATAVAAAAPTATAVGTLKTIKG